MLINFNTSDVKAQSYHEFGIDLSKTVYNNIGKERKGIVIEPVYYYVAKDSNYVLKMPFGYSYVRNDTRFPNTTFNSTNGFYFKPGIGDKKAKIKSYLNLIFAYYGVKSKYVIKGEVFGDHQGEFSKNGIFSFGIEPNFEIDFPISNVFKLILNLRLAYVPYTSVPDDYPVFYVPGAGNINNKLTGGLNLFLVWK